MFLAFFQVFSWSTHISRDNDPIHYMRELEFRNTIDQYDLAIVLFYKREIEECKSALNIMRIVADKSKNRAEFVAVSNRKSQDLCDDLGIENWPTFLVFRYGHLIRKIEEKTTTNGLYKYVKNIIQSNYKYIEDENKAKTIINENNITLLIGMDLVDLRLEKILAVINAKFYDKLKTIVIRDENKISKFGIKKFPCISLVRTQDDEIVEFNGNIKRISVKSFTDFVENNIDPKFELMDSFESFDDKKLYFTCFYDTSEYTQEKIVNEILKNVSTQYTNSFKIRYAEYYQMKRNLKEINMQNYSEPIFMFIQKDNFGYKKWVFSENITVDSVSAFVNNFMNGKITETIISTKAEKNNDNELLLHLDGLELKEKMQAEKNKDFVVNFVGFPCFHCDEIDHLFEETAKWANNNKISNFIFASVNASCNDIPTSVWKNETYPYGWFFPSINRASASPIGKIRNLNLMTNLLVNKSSIPIKVKLPPKPNATPLNQEL